MRDILTSDTQQKEIYYKYRKSSSCTVVNSCVFVSLNLCSLLAKNGVKVGWPESFCKMKMSQLRLTMTGKDSTHWLTIRYTNTNVHSKQAQARVDS